MECWSGWVVCGQVLSASLMAQHLKPKFQYGPGVVQSLPPSLVSNTSSRPTHTGSGGPRRGAGEVLVPRLDAGPIVDPRSALQRRPRCLQLPAVADAVPRPG